MAQTFTTAAMGNAANDGSGNPIRTGGLKIAADLTELYASVAALQGDLVTAASFMRSKLTVAATGAAGQVIAFSSEFVSAYALQIIDYEGIGIEVTAQDADGFTITSLGSGNFGYIALIEV
jgi:hypothetical protein